jgi:hypothetical protein
LLRFDFSLVEALDERCQMLLAFWRFSQSPAFSGRPIMTGIVRRKIAPSRYAHNKFVVFCDADGAPERVWTGSTNWTRTGLCTQNNNGLEIADAKIADAYHKHWQIIYQAKSTTPKTLATTGDHEWDLTVAKSNASVWFTPTSKSGDLAQATKLIAGAEHGVVCLMLNPGNNGLLGPVLEKAADAKLYVRGVLNNFPAQGKDSPKDQLQLLTRAFST